MAIATTGKDVLAKFFRRRRLQRALRGWRCHRCVWQRERHPRLRRVPDRRGRGRKRHREGRQGSGYGREKRATPVVTFYNSVGAKLEEGLAALSGSAAVAAAVAKVSGVVPQIAVVTGVCGAGSALAAAAADVCIVSKRGRAVFDGSVYLCRRRR